MLCRLRNCLNGVKIGLRRLIRDNKTIILVSIASLVIGVLCALIKTKSMAQKECEGNIIILIKVDDFSYAGFYLKLLFITVCLYILGWLSGVNRVFFCINFVIIFLFTYCFLRKIFVSCYVDGWTGYLLVAILYLPLTVISVAIYSMFIAKIYSVSCAGVSWKYLTPLKCYVGSTKKIMLNYCLIAVISEFLFTTLIFVILSICCK